MITGKKERVLTNFSRKKRSLKGCEVAQGIDGWITRLKDIKSGIREDLGCSPGNPSSLSCTRVSPYK